MYATVQVALACTVRAEAEPCGRQWPHAGDWTPGAAFCSCHSGVCPHAAARPRLAVEHTSEMCMRKAPDVGTPIARGLITVAYDLKVKLNKGRRQQRDDWENCVCVTSDEIEYTTVHAECGAGRAAQCTRVSFCRVTRHTRLAHIPRCRPVGVALSCSRADQAVLRLYIV